MSLNRNILPLLLLLGSLTSCIITENISSIQIEIMKPGMFIIPDSLNTIAIVNRSQSKLDSSFFSYFNGLKIISDSTIKYQELSNSTVDAVTNLFKKEGYFANVINYRDTLKGIELDSITKKDILLQKTKSDIFILLDSYRLENTNINNWVNSFYTEAYLAWTIGFKTDTTCYIYKQSDILTYDESQYSSYQKDSCLRLVLLNTSNYLGESFARKIIPSWLTVDRIYYTSKNPDMIRAENLAKNNEWIKAAKIWNKETKNKNPRIATKACYNLALACEMEGEHDAAIDWLIKSYHGLKNSNEEHKANCQQYISVLALRKKEIERVSKQIRN